MKTLRTGLVAALLCLATATALAQKAPNNAFDKFPEEITCNVQDFEAAFKLVTNSYGTVKFGNGMKFSGLVLSNEARYHNLHSLVIESPAFQNSLLHLSRQLNADKTYTYVGRIMNKNTADGYEIQRDEKGNYSLKKINTARLLETCHTPSKS